MADTSAMTIHVSPETREYIRKKIEGGEYSSESDVFEDGIGLLRGDDNELRQWELENVGGAYDELRADPTSQISLEQLEINLATWRRERLKAG